MSKTHDFKVVICEYEVKNAHAGINEAHGTGLV